MGDRGNIKFIDEGEIYFYTHDMGSDLKQIVAMALDRGESRWSDGQYLARIIFCELIKRDVLGTTGYGISTYVGDNENPYVIVDTVNQTVTEDNQIWDFASFVKAFTS